MTLLNRLFKIRSDEWPRLLILCTMLFLTNVGTIWGATIAEAQIWKGGLSILPIIFVINGILAIPGIAIYTAFADRISNTKLYVAILGLSAVGIGAGLILIFKLEQSKLGYGLLYVIAFVLMTDIFGLHWFTYINSFYDTRSAKRVIPVLSTSSRLAGIFAGQMIGSLNTLFPNKDGHIALWLLALVGAASLAWFMPKLLRERPSPTTSSPTTPSEQPAYADSIREGFQYIRESIFLRWMAATTLLLMILLPIINYQTGYILQQNLSTDDISEYLGKITSIANVIMLPIQLVFLSRLIGRIGLANANLIFPSGTFILSTLLVTTRGNVAAGLSYFNRSSFNFSFRGPIDGLLYNAVPVRIKGRARAFIGGFIIPIGSIVGGILLIAGGGARGIIAADSVFVMWFMPVLIVALALAYVVSAYRIKRPYTEALIDMLEQDDYAFLFAQENTDVAIADPTALRSLAQRLEESDSPELKVFIARLLTDVGGNAAVPILEPIVREGEPQIRAILLDVLAAADVSGSNVRQLYVDCLSDPDEAVRLSAVIALERLLGSEDPTYLEEAQKLLMDPSLAVQAQVLPILLRSLDSLSSSLANQAIKAIFASQDAAQRATAVRILGQLNDPDTIPLVCQHASDSADEVRLEVALTLEILTQAGIPDTHALSVLQSVTALTSDPIERVRQAALVVLGRIGSQVARELLVGALTDTSQNVRATAVDIIVRSGGPVIETVRSRLKADDPQQQKMAAMVLSRLNPDQFDELVVPHINQNLLTIYSHIGQLNALAPYAQFPSVGILQDILKERNELLLSEVFYLLTAVHDNDDIDTITQSLHSEEAHQRANATEALESLTTPQTAQLIGPLFEPDTPLAQLLALSRDVWHDLRHPSAEDLLRQMSTAAHDVWPQVAATYALGEIGAMVKAAPDGEAIPKKQRRAQRGRSLLQKLTDDEPANAEEEKPKQSRLRRRSSQLLNALLSDEGEKEEEPLEKKRPANILDSLMESKKASRQQDEPLFTMEEIEALLTAVPAAAPPDLQTAVQAAQRTLSGKSLMEAYLEGETAVPLIEKIILLRHVPFFQGLTISQLRALADLCETRLFERDSRIYQQGDPGGELYIVISGRVGIEQEGERKGSFKRLQTVTDNGYLGEMNLFDGSPHESSAIVSRDTLTLRLRREPLADLARQSSALSLALINVLSQRLREATKQAIGLSATGPSQLQKLFEE